MSLLCCLFEKPGDLPAPLLILQVFIKLKEIAYGCKKHGGNWKVISEALHSVVHYVISEYRAFFCKEDTSLVFIKGSHKGGKPANIY